MFGITGYTSQGTAAYEVSVVSDNGKDTYTIKKFLGGSDFTFTISEKANSVGNPQLGNTAEINVKDGFTFNANDYVTFSKNGTASFRAKLDSWVPNTGGKLHSTSKLSADHKTLYLRRNVEWNNTMEKSTDGTNWTAFSQPSQTLVIAGIIPLGPNDSTGLDDILAEDENAPVEYFNIQGLRVSDPQPGQMVIRRQGSKVSKIIIR